MKTNGTKNEAAQFPSELVAITSLKPHPRNYKAHPDDQLAHIMESIRQFGIYRNIVVTQDGTILAGHGVVQAAKKLGMDSVPVVRVDIDPDSPLALKLLTGDNEISHLGVIDDRLLTGILKEISATPEGLMGTGYDAAMLANLVYVTRPAQEIQDFDAASHWVGMPEYVPAPEPMKIVVSFASEADRQAFGKLLGFEVTETTKSTWFPPKAKETPSALRFEGADDE